jgi:thiamine biosynthesis lipoprotein ApbE
MNHFSSRFWKVAAIVPVAVAAVSAPGQQPAFLLHDAGEEAAGIWSFQHEHVLGTSLEVSVRAGSLAAAEKAEAAVLAQIDRDEAGLSTWRADSEVSRWAKTQFEPVVVSQELFEVLAAFDVWRERTGGALDASVEAATRVWQRATAEGRVPSEHEIAVAVEAMQQPHWRLDREHRTATRVSDVPLALASFTKSYVSSRAADAALKAGATGVMLNVGGDVIVRGDLTQVVAVADPRAAAENDAALEHVVVRDGAVATSGSYRRGFELAEAVRREAPAFSHLIDPRTGQPASHVMSSTVMARDAVTAGALATAFSILPVERSRELAASMPGVQYLLVLAGGEEVRSAGWPQRAQTIPYPFAQSAKGWGNGLARTADSPAGNGKPRKASATASATATADSPAGNGKPRKASATATATATADSPEGNGKPRKASATATAGSLRAVAFERAKPVPVRAAGAWDPAYELSIDLTLPRMDYGRYRRPYVAVWIEDGNRFPVRTLALWTQKPKYLPELREWYREDRDRSQAQGTDLQRTVSSATRPPGSYTLTWDGKDNEGKAVKPGKYTVCIEAAREHGGYDIERKELDFDARPKQLNLPAANELGAITIDYHKR